MGHNSHQKAEPAAEKGARLGQDRLASRSTLSVNILVDSNTDVKRQCCFQAVSGSIHTLSGNCLSNLTCWKDQAQCKQGYGMHLLVEAVGEVGA